MFQGISEGKRAAPGSAGEEPLASTQLLPHGLDVFDQGVGGVLRKAAEIVLNEWRAFATTALVQANNPEPVVVVAFTVAPLAKGTAGAAVKVKDGDARG